MIELCGIPLRGPVLNGSGTFDAIAARRAFGDALVERFPFDAFVSKTITVAPRQGNPPPRLWETPAGLINSIGLPNKGLDGFLESDLPEIAEILKGAGGSQAEAQPSRAGAGEPSRAGADEPSRTPADEPSRPVADEPSQARAGEQSRAAAVEPSGVGGVPLIVSVMGFTRAELAVLVAAVGARDEVAMLELNVSCPNVETGLVMGADPDETALAIKRVRSETYKPLIVKLTPNAADPAAVAVAAQDAGADAVSLVNTLKGMALDPQTGEPWLGGRTGGVSGAAIRAIALEQVAAVAKRVEIPVIGMGGIATGRHAADFLGVGASAVAVGTESFRDPAAGRRVAAELAELSLTRQPSAPRSTSV